MAVLQQAANNSGAPSFGSGTTAGSTIIVGICGLDNINNVTGVTDNKGQVYLQATGALAESSAGFRYSDIWYFSNSAAGVTTVTPSYSVAIQNFVNIIEASSLATTSALRTVGALNNGTASTTQVTAPVTTGAANDFIFVVNSSALNGDLASVASPYTFFSGAGGSANSAYHIPSTIVTNETATFTESSSNVFCASTAVFKGVAIVAPKSNLLLTTG